MSLGRILYHEDPVDNADAIFALGGNWMDRVAETGDLYNEGRARVVVLSRELPDEGERALRARGLNVPGVSDVQIQALTAMGVPRSAIEVIEPQAATATEAVSLRTLAAERGWHRVIVVTSKYHTGRTRLVFRRRLADTGVDVIVRGSRYDRWDPDRWWHDRVWFRITVLEAQKMLVYWLGVAD